MKIFADGLMIVRHPNMANGLLGHGDGVLFQISGLITNWSGS
jgi:hypothetical protein